MKYKYNLIIYIMLGSAIVAFGRMHPYIYNYGVLLDGFENIYDWSVCGAGTTAENDANVFKEGNQSIKLNSVNGVFSCLQKNLNLNFSSGDGFSVWVYIPDKTTISYFGLRVTSTTDWSKYLVIGWNTPLENGWNKMVFCKSEFANYGAESWDNTMAEIMVSVTSKSGQNASIYFDDLRFGIVGEPKVIITFDYGFDSQISKAYPIMATNGQRGVLFPKISALGSYGYLTVTDLQTLEKAGWDISNDTFSHKRLTEISQEEMEEDIDKAYDWLVANGFGSTAKFFAYPFGQSNEAVVAKVKQRHVLARGYSSFEYHFDIVNFDDLQYELRHFWCTTANAADVYEKIDATISKGGLLVLLFQGIVDANPGPYDYLTDDFQAVSDYLKAKQDAGLLEVITFSDYYSALIKYEPFFLEKPATDFNGDSMVDLKDFALFAQGWLEYNLDEKPAMDFNYDFMVDLKDFALFVKSWGAYNLNSQKDCRE
jgi:peptidoglycan/xylan/chitin deacetylase (PgdA/CDA1 family)